MLITKFNKMIRNRLVWTFFAVVVSISFLGFLGPRTSCRRAMSSEKEAGAAGKLNGQAVQESEFSQARYFEMGMRDENAPRTDEGQKKLRQRTWMRIAALRVAQRLGIGVSDTELGTLIRRDPAFKVNSEFNKDRYQSVIQQQLRVGVDTFETYLRESLTRQKLSETMQCMIWTSPSELNQRLRNLTDLMTAEIVTLVPDPAKDMPEVTEEDAKTYFAANKDSFTLPARVSVHFVEFPATNFYTTNDVADAQVNTYYQDHLEQYSTTDTNGTSTEIPLATVRDEIVRILAADGSVYKARDAATEFSMQMIPDRTGKAMSFHNAAASTNLTIQTTDLFAAGDDIPGIQNDWEFAQAAFRLNTNDLDRMVSDPVTSSNMVYVLSLAKSVDSQMQEFSDVRGKAMDLARTNALVKTFIKRAKRSRDGLADAVRAGKMFSAAAAEMGLGSPTIVTFTVYEAMQTNTFENAERFIPRVAWLQTNEISDLVSVPGGFMIGCLTQREPSDFGTAESFRPQLLSTIENYRGGTLFDEWAGSLLREGGFEDYETLDAAAEEERTGTPDRDGSAPSENELQQLL